MLKVLVACEFSGVVREAFAKLGHDAWSCDLLPTDIPGQHYECDIRDVLHNNWDIMIAHPPCTDLAVSGAKHFARKQADGTQQASISFFMALAEADIPHIAIENPIGIMSSMWRKPDQIVHPWMFGHGVKKATCLWLKNLPHLVPTNIVDSGGEIEFPSGKRMSQWYYETSCLPHRMRSHVRSVTFQGIADAMATQYSGYVLLQREGEFDYGT